MPKEFSAESLALSPETPAFLWCGAKLPREWDPGKDQSEMTKFTRTNAGDPQELEAAKAVAEAVAAHYSTYEPDGRDFFLADHTHECLSPGAATVAWEAGPDEWPVWWPETATAAKLARRLRVRFEAVNGVILAVYLNVSAGR